MKRICIIAVLLCLIMSITSMAQSPLDQTITSSGGLTVEYPSNYIGEANEPLAVGLLNLELGIFAIIGVDEASYSFTGEEAQTSEELKDGFLSIVNLLGGGIDESIQDLVINDRPAFLISFDSSSIGIGYFLSFELTDGTPASAMILAAGGTEVPTEIVEDLKAIAASATLDASLATTDDTAEVTSEIITEVGDETEDMSEVEEIPEGAILVEDFPEGMMLTGTGLQMTTLEGFNLVPGTEYVEGSLGLVSSNFQNTVILVDMGELTDEDRAIYAQSAVPMIALMSGNESFDAETDLQEMDVDGRNITYYASPDVAESDPEIGLYYFIVELIPDSNRIATVQVMMIEPDGDVAATNQDQLMEFIQSIELTEEAIAEMNAPQLVECGAQGSSVTDEANAMTLVTCPAGCDSTSGSLWGTEVYTDDSSICVAAIHMGLIDEAGGEVVVNYAKGQDEYVSTELNGIVSSEYGSWGASFTVSAPESE